MEKKYILFGFIALFIIFLSYIIIRSPFSENDSDTYSRSSENNDTKEKTYRSFQMFSGGASEADSFLLDVSKEIYKSDGTWLQEDEIFRAAYKGELDLVSELWSLRRKCPEEYNDYQCQNLVRTFLKDQYGEGRLMNLFDKYTRFERELAELTPPDTDNPIERYNWIKDQRKKSFTSDEIRLIFGLEETLADYSQKRDQFLESTKNLTGDKRLKEYEKFRKKQLGDYYEVVEKREPAYQKFDRELELRSDEWVSLSPEERAKEEREVRLKYFDKEANERMEKVLAEMKAEEEKIASLEKKEATLREKNPNWDNKKWEEEVMKLRIAELGEESAEEYTRRKKYEESLR